MSLATPAEPHAAAAAVTALPAAAPAASHAATHAASPAAAPAVAPAAATTPSAHAPYVQAGDAVRRGNLARAEGLCRLLLERNPRDALALAMLGHVAMRVGRFDVASRCYDDARAAAPHLADLAPYQRMARDAAGRRAAAPRPAGPRWLLVKAWGYGFWSDMDHVLGQLLLAHMTQRVPVVHWGANSLFAAAGADGGNAFTQFFEPVSGITLDDLCAHAAGGAACWPAKWTAATLRQDDVAKWQGDGSRLTGLYGLERGEPVLVSDFHTRLADLLPWIEPGDEFFGLPREAVYRRLWARHIRVQPALGARIDAWWAAHGAGRRWVAVHARGSDKVAEQRDLDAVNGALMHRLDALLQADDESGIFLLTDSEPLLGRFTARFGARVLATPSLRTAGAAGVHYGGHDGRLLGEQVLTDVMLAARCERFLGNGGSNVSVAVRHLRDWPEGRFELAGPDMLGQRSLFLHDW